MGKNSGKIPRDLALLIVQQLGKQPRPAPDEGADDDFEFDYQHGRDRRQH